MVAWSFGDKKPKKSELESAFKMELPGYIQQSDFDVEVLENIGNKVDPRWGSRFKAIVKTKVPLYKQDKHDRKHKITFVVLKNEKNTKTEIYGKITSTIFQGKWKHNFDIEGRPIRNLGILLNEFNGRVMVRGSNEEKEYFANIERQKTALRNNIANATNILIGTWREKCDTQEGLMIYKKDGTFSGKWNNKDYEGVWDIEGDIFNVRYEGLKLEPVIIVDINNNYFKTKQRRSTCQGTRIK